MFSIGTVNFTDTEINNKETIVVFGHKNVFWFQISMHYITIVNVP